MTQYLRSIGMTRALFTIGTILIFSIAASAQEASASGQSAASLIFDGSTTIEGQLQSTLDVKKSKVGDPVVLKTTKAIKEQGRTIVPKGSKLLGRVTDVQQKTKSDNASRLGLLFDRLEGGGLSSEITASIVSITNVAAARPMDSNDSDLFGSASTSSRSSGTASSRGGLLGGGGVPAGGLLGSVGNTVGSTLNAGTAAVGSVTNTASNTVGAATGTVINTVNGIQISQSASGSAQAGATLEAAGRNIKLEKGTSFQLNVTKMGRHQ